MTEVECEYCHYTFPMSSERCPHCARPGLFPNVRAAQDPTEQNVLEQRYETAYQEAASRGTETVCQEFETTVGSSKAVIARPVGEMLRLATSDNEIYSTYYQLIDAGIKIPNGDQWNQVRGLVESVMFPNYKEHIRFAALSLHTRGLTRYGECLFALRDEMIAHRASVFEENDVVWTERQNMPLTRAIVIPPGHRATWNNRHKLAVAKLARHLTPTTTSDEFPGVLLREDTTSGLDDFIEVHIWGPITIRTMESVALPQSTRRSRNVIIKALREKLTRPGVHLEDR